MSRLISVVAKGGDDATAVLKSGLWFRYVNRELRIAMMIPCFLLGVLFVAPFAAIAAGDWAYLFDGVTVQGRVIGKQLASSRFRQTPFASMSPLAHVGGGPRRLLRFEYVDAGGNRHIGVGRVSQSTWDAAKPGDPITVRYLRRDPTTCLIERPLWSFWPAVPFALVGVAAISTSLVQGVRGIRSVHAQVRLITHGRPIRGTIRRVDLESRKRGRIIVSIVEYEYSAPQLVTCRFEMRERSRPNWQTGSEILVLVDPFDATIHAPDIFAARLEFDLDVAATSTSPELARD